MDKLVRYDEIDGQVHLRYDEIEGQIHLDIKHIRERLRAEAMRKIRSKYPDKPHKWHIVMLNNLNIWATKKGYSKETGDTIYTFYLVDNAGTTWAEANYEVLV